MNALTCREIAIATGGTLTTGGEGIIVTGVSTDTRDLKAGDVFFALRGERWDGHNFVQQALNKGATLVVVSCAETSWSFRPSQGMLLVDDTTKALGDVASYYRGSLPAKLIGITGSTGKTTAKSMLNKVLCGLAPTVASPKSFNNHIGVPLTILSADRHHKFVILEMGTNHFGEIRYLGKMARPEIGVILNVGPSHLEGLIDEEGVARAKAELLPELARGATAILNADNRHTREMARSCSRKILTFGESEDANFRITELGDSSDGLIFKVNNYEVRLNVAGRHNAWNAAACIAICGALGLDLAAAVEGLAAFQPPPMRMEKKQCAGVMFLNDMYNSNPLSAKAALDTLAGMKTDGRRIFLCSDMRELGASSEALHGELGAYAAQRGIDALYAIGDHARFTALGAREAGLSESLFFEEIEDVVGQMAGSLKPGDAVLLKASRAMGLEKVMSRLEEVLAKMSGNVQKMPINNIAKVA
ncbi:MAG TPA: UDP-N-acetylmuramoyl-tripeptide--D-alanyl-D-alanine ligase [Candidatus Brocadiia bacterium]|nr:UDP-N-acetylmuramoyl-tripeptide--D-alanyl-D-alanine ligase [Candidatus Brocadiia bacterium]